MKKLLAVLVTILLLLPSLATATQKGVELSSRAEVEVSQKNDTGETVVNRIAADKANVAPGDTVIFTIAYTNKGEQAADKVVINNPIPQHLTYTDSSAEGAGTRIEYSVDNGKSYGQLATLLVKTAAGKEKPASAADITTVRWTLEKPLAPGTGGSVSYKAKVK